MRKHISFAVQRTSTNAVTWWFAPLGGFIAASIMWLLGVPMSFSHWLPDNPVVRGAFDVLVCVVFAYALLFVVWAALSALRGRIRLNPWVALGMIGAVILACGVVGYLWDISRGPILWTWNESAPITIGRSGDDYGIQAFTFRGINRWEKPVSKIKTFVKSNVTDEEIPLTFENRTPASAVTIPPGIEFSIFYLFPQPGPGMKFSEFNDNFGSFTFLFEHNGGKPTEIYFDDHQVKKIIARGLAFHQDAYERLKTRIGPKIKINKP